MIDKQMVQEMREALANALQIPAAGFEMDVEVGNARFSSTYVTFKVTFSTVDNETGVKQTKEAEAFKRLAKSYGLDPEWLGVEFWFREELFIITGFNSRAKTYPVQATRHRDGRKFKFPCHVIQDAIG